MDKDGDEDVYVVVLNFLDIEEGDEMEILYEKSRVLIYGDYVFFSVDICEEEVRKWRWEEDENMLKWYKV